MREASEACCDDTKSLASILTALVVKTSVTIAVIMALIFFAVTVQNEISLTKQQGSIEHSAALAQIRSKVQFIQTTSSNIAKYIANSSRYDSLTNSLDKGGVDEVKNYIQQTIDVSNGSILGISISGSGLNPIISLRTAAIAASAERLLLASAMTAAMQLSVNPGQDTETLSVNDSNIQAIAISVKERLYSAYRSSRLSAAKNDKALEIRIIVLFSNDLFSDFLMNVGAILRSKGFEPILSVRANGIDIAHVGTDKARTNRLFEVENKSVFLQATGARTAVDYVFESKITKDGKLEYLIIRLIFALVVGFSFVFYSWWLIRRQIPLVMQPLYQITEDVISLEDSKFEKSIPIVGPVEVSTIRRSLEQMRKKLIEVSIFETRSKLAAQVAHDIRSPLSALDIVMRTETSMPEEKRILARSAITRITDIANNLLEKNKPKSADDAESSPRSVTAIRSNELLASVIDSLMSEKRLQFRTKLNVEIEYQPEVGSYGLFADISSIEFKRVLSNLINNSIEALPNNSGQVQLQLNREGENIVILIIDNGKGIPEHILPKLGAEGASFGKGGTESGSGLGLFHARQTIESFGGKLEIESTEGKGTTIKIILPKSPVPSWFVEKLEFKAKSRIVIADDDSSIHQIWDGRFDSAQVERHGIEVLHFSTPSDLQTWYQKQVATRDVLFLVDYEFLGQKQNGLDIIKTLGIGKQSILVTSRYEEPQILQTAQNMGVRMIPKGMAGLVPISFIAPSESIDAILIDDDELVHMTWSGAAKDAGQSLKVFFKPEDFFVVANRTPLSANIYIDVNLADGVRGEDVAKRVYDLGCENIYLATGYDKEQFSHLTFLKGVIGKDPPWVSSR
ncbi:MAG: hypothetical protein A2Z20_06455 [Bdellovibrionales bacterium RBG_16_40_8]|nr:MAG: hypothetical protein A2Z20_06455 [Bdellovibrionales bacterium RBG_16_40_8]